MLMTWKGVLVVEAHLVDGSATSRRELCIKMVQYEPRLQQSSNRLSAPLDSRPSFGSPDSSTLQVGYINEYLEQLCIGDNRR